MSKNDGHDVGKQPASKLWVLVTSNDGHLKHPFDGTATVGEVRRFAYDHLVKAAEQTPFDQTWIEFNGQRTADVVTLASLAVGHRGGGSEPDLTFALAWATSGGR